MKNDDDKFLDVKRAFIRGDPRPLAQWVLSNGLSEDQRKFVSDAILGEVEKIDGRTIKPHTEALEADFGRFVFLNFTLRVLCSAEHETLSNSEISRRLADKYGYKDSDSVRRALNRFRKKMKEEYELQMQSMINDPGRLCCTNRICVLPGVRFVTNEPEDAEAASEAAPHEELKGV